MTPLPNTPPFVRSITALVLCGLFVPSLLAQDQPSRGLREAVGRAPERGDSAETTTEAEKSEEAKIDSLTLEQRIAQLLIVTMGGIYQPNPSDREIFKDTPPGGVIIPAVVRPSEVAQYITGLRGQPIETVIGIPLFIGTNMYALAQNPASRDQAFMELPSMLSIVAADDPAATAALAKRVADQLYTMGFNLHLGPSLLLAASLKDARGSIQNFGSDPKRVSAVGAVFYGAFHDAGLVSAAMGFPGGGSNRIDGGPAVLLTPAPQLVDQELLPFRRAVELGVAIMHVSNTIVPTLDKSMRPASQSPLVIEGLLKYRLGFEGLVLAGPIDSRDLAKRQSPSKAAIESLRAGADMLYLEKPGRQAMKVIRDVAAAVREGVLSESQIDKALDRVIAAKKKAGLKDRPLPDSKAAERIEENQPAFDEAYRIERRAITLVQDATGVLPLSKGTSMPIGVTGIFGVEELHDALEEYIKKIAKQRITTARHVRRVQDFEIDRLMRSVAGMKTAVLILSSDLPYQGQSRIISGLQESGVRVVVVLLGYPRYLPHFRHADAIICAYTSGESIDQTMRAVADILVGNAPIKILPALHDLKRNVGETIRFDVRDVVQSPVGQLPATVGVGYEVGMSASYDPGEYLKRVEWDFGDGRTSKDPTTEHAYKTPGRYTVQLTVSDGKGQQSSGTFGVVVE